MAANSREARRRRILDQGSDRLALITGRIQNLPPPSSHPSPSPQYKPPDSESDADADAVAGSSSQLLISDDQPIRPHNSHQNSNSDSPCVETESDSIFLNQNPVTEPYQSDAYESRSAAATAPLHKHEGENENSTLPTSEVELEHVQTTEHKLFSPREISAAISTSQNTRLCCSVAVALLVLVSYLGFPIIGSKFIKSIISFRPLYLVLVTNLTLMVARLLSSKQRGVERAERRQNKTSDEGHWAQQLAKTLEAGWVMQNVIDAIFMDCAIYVIIVVCGLSLVQT